MMPEKKIHISVITPFYRGNMFMEQLFGCVRKNASAAPDLGIELILINDSPDCTVQYQESWICGYSVQILNHPVNMGIHQSRITGLKAAKGEFVIFLDQDDLLADHALSSQYHIAEHADIAVSNGRNENRRKEKFIYTSLAHQKQVVSLRFYLSVGCMIVSPGQCLIRRNKIPDLWTKIRINCNGSDDYFLWLLLLQEDCRWTVNPEVLYTHVDTGENVSADLDRMVRSSVEVLDILKQNGKLTDRQDRIAKRRFEMRRFYEGREKWRKAAACILYPDLFLELLKYTLLKKIPQSL